MAQANSAQREPSMEEILASIRRIIEDSETGQKAGSAAAPADAAGSPAVDVEAFRAELRPVPDAVSPDDGEPEANVRQETERAPFRWPHNDGADLGRAAAEEPEEADRRKPESGGLQSVLKLTNAPGASSATEKERVEPAAAEARQAPRPAEVGTSGHDDNAPARPAMVSADTGRKVAAAFGELNEVFEAKRAKGLDQVAEEMLRPMLQEWLDNNLPTLVERLVREEIERVARGG
ncbi:PopZ family protein [Nitratireductor thuwali]|uniref:DUF2497 domain-containing protein n=1 Tax=Nitratireductor thuwali TaxID=2267699 RepID=A0ABY5MR81_9HYPH|nr:hypothetical protein NTH_03800 [Nitratireductor thuwali]